MTNGEKGGNKEIPHIKVESVDSGDFAPGLVGVKKTLEIPAAMARLGREELSVMMEQRLRGERAGLTKLFRDEAPDNILYYAYENSNNPSFQERFRSILAETTKRILSSDSRTATDTFFSNLFFLVGRIGGPEIKKVASDLLPMPPCLNDRLLQCWASILAAQVESGDVDQIKWFEEHIVDPRFSRIALRGLYKVDPSRAGTMFPLVAETHPAAEDLARVLTLMLASNKERSRLFFNGLKEVTRTRTYSPKILEIMKRVLERIPGVEPEDYSFLNSGR